MGEPDPHGDPLSVFSPENTGTPLLADSASPLPTRSTPSGPTWPRVVQSDGDWLLEFLPEEVFGHSPEHQPAGLNTVARPRMIERLRAAAERATTGRVPRTVSAASASAATVYHTLHRGLCRCWTRFFTGWSFARAQITMLLNIGVSPGRRTAMAMLGRLIASRVVVLWDQVSMVTRSHVHPSTIAVPVGAFLCGVGVGALVMGLMRVPLDRHVVPSGSIHVLAAPEVVYDTRSGEDASPGIPTSRLHAVVAPPVNTAPVGSRAPVVIVETPSPVAPRLRTPAASRGEAAMRRATPVRTTSFRGSLSVRSRPQGAQVFINGRMVGTTPVIVRNQPAGSRVVRVTLNGYAVWTSSVRVVAYEQNIVIANLQRARSEVARSQSGGL